MRILQVIHGYPPRYNAGSEIYTQMLSRTLAERHSVAVFTREENPFAPDYAMRTETDGESGKVRVHLVNVTRSRDRYRHAGVDQRFAELLDDCRPDIVHVGHLNHLSSSIIDEAALREVPVVYTLHDYWLMCPRGQFMQTHPVGGGELWAACDGQEDRKCAERCYAKNFGGGAADWEDDMQRWSGWVRTRMSHLRQMADRVDLFIAPSRYLRARFVRDFGLPEQKCVFLPYGFDRFRLAGRRREPGEPFTLGYIGTHIPAKGIQLLLEAFGRVASPARLRIWGRPRSPETGALQQLARSLPGDAGARVEWLGEYSNHEIVPSVFNRVDAVVVPSIWVENSPLVIHEALQARVPVITADAGGMAELVGDGVNGLRFRFRDAASLAQAMQRLAEDAALARKLGNRGYLGNEHGNVPDIREHAREVERLYTQVIAHRDAARVTRLPGPWRITFDTNPDDCNLHCIMCEEHSPYSHSQAQRRAEGRPPRRMPIEIIRRVLEDSRNTGLREIIPSTMGEPLLYEHFDEILELCRQHEVRLNLTTNGTFPRRSAADWAQRIVPVGSDVKISWNGATAATQEAVMLGSQWEKVLENVRAFIGVRDAHAATGGNRCRVTFQLTFLETNIAELPDIVRLAAGLGVDRVKGHHLWTHFEQLRQLSLRRDAQAIARWNEAVLLARAAVQKCRLPDGKPVLLENIFLLEDGATQNIAPGGRCPFLGQEAWVSAEGRFNPCCAPDAQRRTLGEFGNLGETGIREVWNSQAYLELVTTYRTRKLCLGCNMRKPAGA